jgi:hypothetical protein
MTKYFVKASQTVYTYYETEIEADTEEAAQAIALNTPLMDWDDFRSDNADALSIDEIEVVA